MRIALLDDYQGIAMRMASWSRLAGRAEVVAFPRHIADVDALAHELQDFDAVMLMRERTKFPRALIERLPKLKLLITAAMWNASVDVEAAAEHGVQVCGTRDCRIAAAELALGMMIGLVRHIPAEDHAMRDGRWQTTVGVSLHGKTLGIIGLGILGRQMASYGPRPWHARHRLEREPDQLRRSRKRSDPRQQGTALRRSGCHHHPPEAFAAHSGFDWTRRTSPA